MKSELGEALAIAGAMQDAAPRMRAEAAERIKAMILKCGVLSTTADLERLIQHVLGGSEIVSAALKATGKSLRVANWTMDAAHRCQHKAYEVAPSGKVKARIGEIGAKDGWTEAWIA